jgi:hypothetical protein
LVTNTRNARRNTNKTTPGKEQNYMHQLVATIYRTRKTKKWQKTIIKIQTNMNGIP